MRPVRGRIAERLYGALLRLMPGDFEDCRRDALETFHDLHEAARSRGALAGWWLWARLTLRTLGTVVRVRWAAPRRPADVRGPRGWQIVADDGRWALRGLSRHPGFSLAVVAVLALGIGAATAVFSVVDCILLRPLPYPHADRLVFVDEGSHPGPLFQHWQGAGLFESLAAARSQRLDLTGDGPPIEVAAREVNGDFFGLFGARPAAGRLLAASDLAPGRRVAVLGAGLWQRRWGGDPGIVGRTVRLEGEAWTVVGVVDAGFVPPEVIVGNEVDVWLPLDFSTEALRRWDYWMLGVVGKLPAGRGLESLQAELDEIALAAAEEHPKARKDRQGRPAMTPAVPLHQATVGRVESALLMLLGSVTLLLLIGCANVASLFLTRGAERRREMAMRLALGARPRRLAGQLLAESLVLSLAGGAAGIALAFGLTRGFERLVPGDLPRFGEVAVDLRVLAASVSAAVLTGLAFGLAPALQAALARASGVFASAGRQATAGRRGSRARSALVVAEVALALVLLSGAGILGHSLVRLMSSELGFQPGGLVRFEIRPGDGYDEPRRLQLARDLLERLEAVPGVSSAALSWTVPFDYYGASRCCWRSRFTADPEQEPVLSMVHPITPGYLHTLGARVVGRELGWHDDDASPVPVVVNRTLADRVFAGRSALGETLMRADTEMVVVGVVDDVRHWGADTDAENVVYVPYFRYGGTEPEMSAVLRTATPLGSGLADSLRQTVWALDPDLPVGAVATLDERIARSFAEPRFYSLLLGGFAGLAVLLAAIGLYGTLLYMVAGRRREMGIRLAVGARGKDLLRLVLGQGLSLAALGLALGLLGSLAVSRLLSSLVFGITATDPSTYGAVCLVLLAVTAFAAWLPALRAARTDPVTTLRAE